MAAAAAGAVGILFNRWLLWLLVWLLVSGVRCLCRFRMPIRDAVEARGAVDTVDGWKALQRHDDDDADADADGGSSPKLPTAEGVKAHANTSSRPIFCCGFDNVQTG